MICKLVQAEHEIFKQRRSECNRQVNANQRWTEDERNLTEAVPRVTAGASAAESATMKPRAVPEGWSWSAEAIQTRRWGSQYQRTDLVCKIVQAEQEIFKQRRLTELYRGFSRDTVQQPCPLDDLKHTAAASMGQHCISLCIIC